MSTGTRRVKMVEMKRMKLGKKHPRVDHRTLKLSAYLAPSLPAPPPARDWTMGVQDWGMMLNDQLGDCTCASVGHFQQLVTMNTSTMFTPTDDQILAAYEAVGGYKPGDESTDNGAVEIDVLNYYRTTGVAGRKLLAYADPSPADKTHVMQAINLFGCVYIGLALPITAQDQILWDVVNGIFHRGTSPGSWGGHAVICPAYDDEGLTCITWGEPKKMTWAFWNKYCDESHALLSSDWIGAKGSPSGFDIATLQQDLQSVTQ